jgi:hypothetical protein
MSQRLVQNPWLTDVFTTAGATPTLSTNTAFATPSGSSGVAELRVLARNTGTGAMVFWHAEVPWKNVAGTLTVGTLLNVGGAALAAMASIAADLTAFIGATISLTSQAGATIQSQVTGLAATSIEWLVDMRCNVN